jgi:hypothetical protein
LDENGEARKPGGIVISWLFLSDGKDGGGTIMILFIAALLAGAQAPAVAPVHGTAIGPKQDDPRACGAGEGIIVQGGLARDPENDPRATGGALAIGLKQDDPRAAPGGALAIGPKQDDPLVAPGRVRAIGPKQDDPRAPARAGRDGDDKDPHATHRAACRPVRR